MPKPGVILDRDGTLIDFYRDVELGVVTPAFHPDQVRLLPGVTAGLRQLQQAGFVLAIATNQPDAAKGRVPLAAIEATNRRLLEVLADAGIGIAALRACCHHPEGAPGGDERLIMRCDCRKPAAGMLLSHIRELRLDVARTWMVGDTASDAQAAQAAGLRMGLLMRRQRCELCVFSAPTPQGVVAHARAERLDELAAIIVVDGAPDSEPVAFV